MRKTSKVLNCYYYITNIFETKNAIKGPTYLNFTSDECYNTSLVQNDTLQCGLDIVTNCLNTGVTIDYGDGSSLANSIVRPSKNQDEL